MKEKGIIIDVKKDKAIIQTILHKECKGCGTCGAGKSRNIVIIGEYKEFKKGEKVDIEIDSSIMFKLYMLLYGMPLLTFILTLLLVYSFSENPSLSFLVSILATAGVYLSVGKYIKRKKEFSPKIKRVLK